MTLSRRTARVLAVLLLLAAIAAAAASFSRSKDGPAFPDRPQGERPKLLLLTSLPILFPEEFTLDAPASPVLEALQRRYRVEPISVTDEASLGKSRLLLAAQPQAQPGEYLVALDAWVRRGGRVLLLADPALRWPSERPLGDPLRPPLAFADTGLLKHWGLRLDSPDSPGPVTRTVGSEDVRTVAPGTLVSTGDQCTVEDGGLVAVCKIGRGEARIIADADFLAVDTAEGASARANLEHLIRQLALLEQ